MKKDKEWLKEQVAHEQNDGLYFRENYSQYDYFVDVEDLLPLIDQLDEPEVEENFYTFDNAKKWLQDNGFVVFEKDKLDAEVQRMIDETYEATNEKPVLPQHVADWIDAHNLYGNNPLREYRDLESDFNEGWTDEKDAAISEVLEVANELDEAEEVGVSKKESKVDLRYYKEALEELNNDVCNLTYHHKESVEALYKNLLKLTNKLIEECEVEEEKNYRFKTGDKYIRFNLDGTMMGSTKQNATISKERLEKLPFDVEKAVVSGVVILEEVTP